MKRFDFAKWYPAGYEYKKEIGLVMGLAGIGMFGSLHFFEVLYREEQRLGFYVEGEWFLREGKMAASFTQLADWYWAMWVPVLLFLFVMPLYRYFYYYREAKSIYVMRRLPERGVLFKSCVQGTMWSAAAVCGAALLLYLLYFGIYMLCIPAEMRRFV